MVTGTTAKLAGKQLDTTRPVGWSFTSGVLPHVETFDVDEKVGQELMEIGGAVELEIDQNGRRLRIEQLYIIGEGPNPRPGRKTIMVADQRLWWSRVLIKRRYNIRRRTGDRRFLRNEGGVPEQLREVVNDVAYAAWSLEGPEQPWTAVGILRDVLDEVAEGNYTIGVTGLDQVIDSVELDDPAPSAINRALSHIPGAEIAVTKEGQVLVYNSLNIDGSKGVFDQLKPRLVSGQIEQHVDQRLQRPETVSVGFDVEQEVRFTSIRPGETVTQDERYMDNVVQVPDPQLYIPSLNKTVIRGTFITFEQAFEAWNADKGNSNLPDISDEYVRQWWWGTILEGKFGGLGSLNPDISWLRRIGAVRAHWRMTWRINHRWLSRIYSMRAYRCSSWDPETGGFAESHVHMGHMLFLSARGKIANRTTPVMNFRNSPSTLYSSLEGVDVAPLTVSILDEQQGLIRFDYAPDLVGNFAQFWPANMKPFPDAKLSEAGRKPITVDGSRARGQKGIKAEAAWRCAVVVTVTPGSPNSREQLMWYDVSPEEAGKYLPQGASTAAIEGGQGPAWDVRVGGALASARFGWSQDKYQLIEQTFGIGGETTRDVITDLITNEEQLLVLARTMAAGIYFSLADHTQGFVEVDYTPEIQPVGNIRQIRHELQPSGAFLTRISAPNASLEYDPQYVLPDSVRQAFQRLTQLEK